MEIAIRPHTLHIQNVLKLATVTTCFCLLGAVWPAIRTTQLSHRIKSDWSKRESGQWAKQVHHTCNVITVKKKTGSVIPVSVRFSVIIKRFGSVMVNRFPTLLYSIISTI